MLPEIETFAHHPTDWTNPCAPDHAGRATGSRGFASSRDRLVRHHVTVGRARRDHGIDLLVHVDGRVDQARARRRQGFREESGGVVCRTQVGRPHAKPPRDRTEIDRDAVIRREDAFPIEQVLLLVHQQQDLFYGKRIFASDYRVAVDFCAVARGFGMRTADLGATDDPAGLLAEALAAPGPCLIHAPIDVNEKVYPMVPPGAANRDMVAHKAVAG